MSEWRRIWLSRHRWRYPRQSTRIFE